MGKIWGEARWANTRWLCLTDLDTVIPSIPRIAKDAEQVNAAELDKPDPACRNSPNQCKVYYAPINQS